MIKPEQEQIDKLGVLAWVPQRERERIMGLSTIHRKLALKNLDREVREFLRQAKKKKDAIR